MKLYVQFWCGVIGFCLAWLGFALAASTML